MLAELPFGCDSASILQDREDMGLNTLDCEFGEPPPHSMPVIIECAILGSPYQKLTLSELRMTLKRRFRHYEIEEEKGVKSWEVSPTPRLFILIQNFHFVILHITSLRHNTSAVHSINNLCTCRDSSSYLLFIFPSFPIIT